MVTYPFQLINRLYMHKRNCMQGFENISTSQAKVLVPYLHKLTSTNTLQFLCRYLFGQNWKTKKKWQTLKHVLCLQWLRTIRTHSAPLRYLTVHESRDIGMRKGKSRCPLKVKRLPFNITIPLCNDGITNSHLSQQNNRSIRMVS